MSGHSKWSTIKHKKGAKDAKRAKIFTKIIREITVAAKLGGGDPDANARLRAAMLNARAQNMPSDTVQRAIKKGAGGEDNSDYAEVMYEGYGPGNVAVVVETLTDNRNRTASNIRTLFNKNHGSLGATNSVLYMFSHMGEIQLPKDGLSEDQLMEHLLEAGAEDLDTEGENYVVTCQKEDFEAVKHYFEKQKLPMLSTGLAWVAGTKTPVEDKETAEKALAFLDALEDDDDVQKVYSNLDISDAIMDQLD